MRTAPHRPAPFRKPTTNIRLSSSYYTCTERSEMPPLAAPGASRLRPAASKLSSTVGTQAGSVNIYGWGKRGPDSSDRVAPAGVNYGALRQISSSVRPNHPGAEIGGSASKLGERKNSARSKSLTARLNRVRRAGQKPGGLPVGGDACRLGSALRLQRPTRKGHGKAGEPGLWQVTAARLKAHETNILVEIKQKQVQHYRNRRSGRGYACVPNVSRERGAVLPLRG